jgi:hypothetical protein
MSNVFSQSDFGAHKIYSLVGNKKLIAIIAKLRIDIAIFNLGEQNGYEIF